MSRDAMQALAKYPEVVVTGLDAEGYPWSVRAPRSAYGEDGRLPLILPDGLQPAEGKAGLLAHHHDADLGGMRMQQVKGRLERDGTGWVFVTEAFVPVSMWAMIRSVPRKLDDYLKKHGIERPKVNYAAIDEMWAEAKRRKAQTPRT